MLNRKLTVNLNGKSSVIINEKNYFGKYIKNTGNDFYGNRPFWSSGVKKWNYPTCSIFMFTDEQFDMLMSTVNICHILGRIAFPVFCFC